MSKTSKELQSNAESRWFIRIDSGDTYGPVDLPTLKEWAAQGRVEPDNEISEDQESWRQAESLRELEMDWMAELDDGTSYGPFNIALAPELADRGVLPTNATLRNRETGETRPVAADTKQSDDTADDSDSEAQISLSLDDPPATPQKPKRKATRSRKKAASKTAKKPKTTPKSKATPAKESAEAPTDGPPAKAPVKEEETKPEATAEAVPEVEPNPPESSAAEPEPIDAEKLPAESHEVVSLRLETLQKSASQARAQLAATRKELSEQRAATSAMQDQIRKLTDDIRNAEMEKADSERRLLEQQDSVTQAMAEVENLNAQLQQLQDHYDRLQIESQNQFEELDRLRADAIQREQVYKHNITQVTDRASAKTALLGQALRLIVQDEDLEKGQLPKELLTASDPGQLQDLQTRMGHLQQQFERERQHTQQLEAQLAATRGSKGRNAVLIFLLLLVAGLICALAFVLGNRHGYARAKLRPTRVETTVAATVTEERPSDPAPQPTEKTALAGLIVTNSERLPLDADAAVSLDLPPEENGHAPEAPVRSPVEWPTLDLERGIITKDASRCRVVFTYGVFSSGTQMTPDAAQDLEQLSNQLRDQSDTFALLVEGHTDATPIKSSRSKYVDNYALGMARAERVKLFLEDDCSLPVDFIQTASAGEADPPHPNTSESSRLKNRTVVLTLTPR